MNMITRRAVLAGGAGSLLAAPAILRAQQAFTEFPFRLGIASGDPSHDGFVIWTRLCADPLDEHGGMPMAPIEVDWAVYGDEGMRTIVQKGRSTALPELGHSIHVELNGLEPDRPYWYRFNVGGERTQLGRSRTTPLPGKPYDRLRFAAAGCQSWEDGLFTALGHLAREDVAFIWHYGDYIYEERTRQVNYERDGSPRAHVRDHIGPDCYTIGDFRRRYAQYKVDPHLQAAHRLAPWFVSIDDHDIADNWTGAVSPTQADPAVFAIRRAAGMQAFYEHMPLRKSSMPVGPDMRLHRRIRFGDLLDAHFLDTRQYRTKQACGGGFAPTCPETGDAKRTVLGSEQEAEFLKALRDKGSRWNLVAQQVMMMPLDRRGSGGTKEIRNMDSWAGYDVSRERALAAFEGLGNVVVMTGDEHQNFAGELRRGGKAVAVEMVSTSITSGGDGWVRPEVAANTLAANPFLKYSSDRRGYMICEVSRDLWQTSVRGVDQVTAPGGSISNLATITVERGKPALNIV